MPRPRKPAHLRLDDARRDRQGRITHHATWVVIDGKTKRSTGCGEDDYPGAEAALQRYLAERHAEQSLPKNRAASEILIADILRHYLDSRKDDLKAHSLVAIRFGHLLDFWGDKTLDDIDSRTCRRYVESRHPYTGGARRELEDLRSAINLAIADKLCREAVKVTLPKKPGARKDYLERDAAAKLIWHAYRKREQQVISRGPRKGEIVETSKKPMLHVARFTLFALYTGTRSGRVWTASFNKEPGRPWIDVDGGIFYREAPGETASETKQAPSIRIPKRLLAHLRRWRDEVRPKRGPTRYLCEYRAGSPADPKKAFARMVRDVLGDEGEKIVRHSLRHTAATWLLMAGNDPHRVAGFLGMRTDTLIKVYGHHHPLFQEEIGDSFSTGKAGRKPSRAA